MTLDGSEWVDSRLGCFNHVERTASNQLLVHQSWSGRFGEKKSRALAENRNPDHPANSLVVILTLRDEAQTALFKDPVRTAL